MFFLQRKYIKKRKGGKPLTLMQTHTRKLSWNYERKKSDFLKGKGKIKRNKICKKKNKNKTDYWKKAHASPFGIVEPIKVILSSKTFFIDIVMKSSSFEDDALNYIKMATNWWKPPAHEVTSNKWQYSMEYSDSENMRSRVQSPITSVIDGVDRFDSRLVQTPS